MWVGHIVGVGAVVEGVKRNSPLTPSHSHTRTHTHTHSLFTVAEHNVVDGGWEVLGIVVRDLCEVGEAFGRKVSMNRHDLDTPGHKTSTPE